MAVYLGIDIGTSAVKAVLVDEKDAVVDQASAPLAVSRPHAGWSEQNPADWWAATNAAVTSLAARLRKRVSAVGLSGQMHGATLLDASDRVLRPAILWNDGRSETECNELEAREPQSRRITGNLAMPGFTAPKLIWVKKHEPEVFAATRTVLLPKDYVRLRMTGEKASDLSDAAGTLWVDVARRAWSAPMLAACDMSEAHMPRLCEGPDATGVLRAELAEAWGMARAPVAAGGGDNAAGAVGVGVINPGEAFLSLGTSGVLFLANKSFLPNPARAVHAFCHALPDRWHQMTVMLSAASCVDWAARATGVGEAAAMFERLTARARMDGPEVFLPYLSGERTPHNDAHARGVLFGLNHDSDGEAIGQAVLEGVAFAFADGLDVLIEAGATIDKISVIGGGARSMWWGGVLSAALKRPLIYRDASEVGPAFGAARLARIAKTGERAEDVCRPPPVRVVVEPNQRDIEQLAPKRKKFSQIYQDLRPRFRGV
jgi:xylulokinase